MSTSSSPWPNGAQGAVSLSFDDGLPSQLELAIPILDKYGLLGTFYVNPRDNYQEQLVPWHKAARTGHEIGNHTVNHPCSKNFAFIADSNRRSLEEMSLADIEGEIVAAGRRIAEVIPEQGPVSFGYTCYQPFVGRGPTRQSYVPMVAKHCVAGRGRGEQPNHPRYCDLWYLWSTPCERMTGAEMVGVCEQAPVQDRWAILTFHGIDDGHLLVGHGDFEELCAYLARNRERIWVAPVAKVAQRVAEYQKQN
ncbi:MAG TPA: polysaccharide deacetylase family protein [Caldilineaceae bacterium]|nr:polysaccharide deacetylase family protein [Caldilineaceae bacterium]